MNLISSKKKIRLNILCLILIHKQIYQYIKRFEYKIYIYEKLGFGNLNTMQLFYKCSLYHLKSILHCLISYRKKIIYENLEINIGIFLVGFLDFESLT